ncbi:NADH-FMN oxidoreductase RutF, flavin reductase (DIM6/NTAB) family [Quadrisphaera granulorum]|uniref:Flavin reductase (DIM6/NTAB) family NADH-FMN oxidoreductase RutF n=1 Tax=Quadrisphaera granulorum TaxID=317664 RepID=A0A316AIR7_9ACTN|nr:flavin reductase (DIM6/NTAB) family NADH-FMN oxidoreductase RutF [Quadrisphaera granulorum]SZE98045.1 NADH-FMN oxidoreductase RutF, flavin reductase (DIM6/NTAB) family [Quadrisphaera granulorum]
MTGTDAGLTDVDDAPDAASAHRALRDAFGRFPSGVVSACARIGGTPIGMAMSSFTSVSLDPPLVLVCVDRASSTWPKLREAGAGGRLGISVLGEAHDTTARQLASRTADRFAGLSLVDGDGGAVFVDGAAAWLECSVEEELPGGDHVVVLLRVHAHRVLEPGPLVFHASGFTTLPARSR